MSARLAPPSPLMGVTVDDLDLACLGDLSKFPDGSVAPAQLWEALDAVGADEAVSLSDRDRLELVEAWRRLEAASTARRLEQTAAFALTPVNGSGIGGSVREFADAELALRTRATKYTAARDLTTALRLGDVMPRVGAALRAG